LLLFFLFTVLFAPYCILKLFYSAIRLSSRKCVNKLSVRVNNFNIRISWSYELGSEWGLVLGLCLWLQLGFCPCFVSSGFVGPSCDNKLSLLVPSQCYSVLRSCSQHTQCFPTVVAAARDRTHDRAGRMVLRVHTPHACNTSDRSAPSDVAGCCCDVAAGRRRGHIVLPHTARLSQFLHIITTSSVFYSQQLQLSRTFSWHMQCCSQLMKILL